MKLHRHCAHIGCNNQIAFIMEPSGYPACNAHVIKLANDNGSIWLNPLTEDLPAPIPARLECREDDGAAIKAICEMTVLLVAIQRLPKAEIEAASVRLFGKLLAEWHDRKRGARMM